MDLNSLTSSIEIIHDSGSIQLLYYQLINSNIPSILYAERVMRSSEIKLPTNINKHLICCLFPSQDQQTAIHFLQNLYIDQLICLAYDESAENVYLIFFCNIPHVNNFVLLRLCASDIWTENCEFYKQIQTMYKNRINDIIAKRYLTSIFENYQKVLKS